MSRTSTTLDAIVIGDDPSAKMKSILLAILSSTLLWCVQSHAPDGLALVMARGPVSIKSDTVNVELGTLKAIESGVPIRLAASPIPIRRSQSPRLTTSDTDPGHILPIKEINLGPQPFPEGATALISSIEPNHKDKGFSEGRFFISYIRCIASGLLAAHAKQYTVSVGIQHTPPSRRILTHLSNCSRSCAKPISHNFLSAASSLLECPPSTMIAIFSSHRLHQRMCLLQPRKRARVRLDIVVINIKNTRLVFLALVTASEEDDRKTMIPSSPIQCSIVMAERGKNTFQLEMIHTICNNSIPTKRGTLSFKGVSNK
mmetsp:Transcript_24037/g.33765  ORF Transcript_24037/g.33765 Transcript_24037/m.33765 type:complete len:315 (+) Transcript_24037:1400-2344(+)